jgi:predicted nucleic acid-binding protein
VNESAIYLDSSALIKLVFEEDESTALRRFLRDHPRRASSVLARVEVLRTAARVEDPTVTKDARELLARVYVIWPDEAMLAAASNLAPPTLRTCDAIHLATAMALRPHIDGMVVYDRRLAQAARGAGLTVWAPA